MSSQFHESQKKSLKANGVIVLADFAENYQFLLQDEIHSYHWSKEYCTLHPVVYNTILFVSSLMITTVTKILFVRYKQSLLITLERTFQKGIRSFTYLTALLNFRRIVKTLSICVITMDAEWIFFATSHGKSLCDCFGEFVKCHVAKGTKTRALSKTEI